MNALIGMLDRWQKRIKAGSNPRNLLALHHASDARRYGDTFGAHSYGRVKIRRWGEGATLHIGKFCSIADDVTVFLGGNHRGDWISTFPFSDFADQWPSSTGHPSTLTSKGNVTVGHDVWVGAGATILSGVNVGHGAIIGARAVVTRDVAPYAVVGGNPATVLKVRFAPETVSRLLAAEWWSMPDECVGKITRMLQSPDIEALLAHVDRLKA